MNRVYVEHETNRIITAVHNDCSHLDYTSVITLRPGDGPPELFQLVKTIRRGRYVEVRVQPLWKIGRSA